MDAYMTLVYSKWYTSDMNTIQEYLKLAEKQGNAIGHFNISNSDGFWAVVHASRELESELSHKVPVIIGVSEGERDCIGVEAIALMVRNAREKYNIPLFLNADHTYSFDRVKEAVDAGYDAVIFDGTELSFDANVVETKKCKEYIVANRPEMLLEAELGFIGKSSKVLDGIPDNVKLTDEFLTDPKEAQQFITETGADMLAPAVGNIHGMLKGGIDPALSPERVRDIAQATKVPLVLHGASGNSDADIQACIKAGVRIVHVNTELRVAFKQGLVKYLQDNPDEIAPYKYLKSARDAMKEVIKKKLLVFINA